MKRKQKKWRRGRIKLKNIESGNKWWKMAHSWYISRRIVKNNTNTYRFPRTRKRYWWRLSNSTAVSWLTWCVEWSTSDRLMSKGNHSQNWYLLHGQMTWGQSYFRVDFQYILVFTCYWIMKRQQNLVHRVSFILPWLSLRSIFLFRRKKLDISGASEDAFSIPSITWLKIIFPGLASLFMRLFVNVLLNKSSLELYSRLKFANLDLQTFPKHLVLTYSALKMTTSPQKHTTRVKFRVESRAVPPTQQSLITRFYYYVFSEIVYHFSYLTRFIIL